KRKKRDREEEHRCHVALPFLLFYYSSCTPPRCHQSLSSPPLLLNRCCQPLFFTGSDINRSPTQPARTRALTLAAAGHFFFCTDAQQHRLCFLLSQCTRASADCCRRPPSTAYSPTPLCHLSSFPCISTTVAANCPTSSLQLQPSPATIIAPLQFPPLLPASPLLPALAPAILVIAASFSSTPSEICNCSPLLHSIVTTACHPRLWLLSSIHFSTHLPPTAPNRAAFISCFCSLSVAATNRCHPSLAAASFFFPLLQPSPPLSHLFLAPASPLLNPCHRCYPLLQPLPAGLLHRCPLPPSSSPTILVVARRSPSIGRHLPLFTSATASSYAFSPWPVASNRALLIFFPLPQSHLPQPCPIIATNRSHPSSDPAACRTLLLPLPLPHSSNDSWS
ncbi:hypothetical protein B296_00014419, partial [Ensete ventricosum]